MCMSWLLSILIVSMHGSTMTFIHILWFHFLSLYIWLYDLYTSVEFCKLYILIVMLMYSYCNVCSVLGILFHRAVLCTVCA